MFVGVDFGKQWRCMQWYMMDSFLAEHVTFDCMMCRCEDILCPGEDYEAKIAAMKRRANFMQWNTHNITNMVLYITIICLGIVGEWNTHNITNMVLYITIICLGIIGESSAVFTSQNETTHPVSLQVGMQYFGLASK